MTTLTAHVFAECRLNYPEACTDERCEADVHLPDRGWTEVDELAAELWDDDRFRRRCDV